MGDANGLTIDYLPCGRNGSAVVTARLGDDVIGHEKIDFGKPDARSRFSTSLTKGRPGIDAAIVDKELLRIGAELSARHAKGDDDQPGQPDAAELLGKMPELVRAEARAMLEKETLFVDCYRDIADLGVAGEETLAGSVFLIGVSRLLPRPLAGIVSAPSSTGKSYVVERVADVFPPESTIHATAMTAQSLYYLEPGALRHKFIVAGERSRREDDDTAEATRALREMIGSGRLSKLVPFKEGGRMVTQRIEQEGPISYVETTTLANVFEEDANRCLLLSADERTQQTRAVIRRLADSYGGANTINTKAIINRHHALQRMLQQRPVYVPFASRIGESFPDDRVEARRAFGHLMGVIQASALLHQYQRQLDGDGRIVAAAGDYQLARLLCRGPLARLLGGRISDAALRFYDRLTGWVIDRFTTGEAHRRDRKAPQNVRAWLRELADAGAVEQIESAKGSRPATWKLTGMDRAELAAGDCGLPEIIT